MPIFSLKVGGVVASNNNNNKKAKRLRVEFIT